MSSLPTPAIIALALAGVLFVLKKRFFRIPYPPSPPADPIIGHVRRLPSESLEDRLSQWARIYGKHSVCYL
jgi:hypothetical protein